MAEQKKRTSNIPRLSRLPVRTSIAGVPRQVQTARDTKAQAGDFGVLKVSKSRPATHQAHPQQPTKQTDNFAKPSVRSTPAREEAAAAQKSWTDAAADGHKEQVSEDLSNGQSTRPTTTPRPRPSLADRAIESLSQIPPSPSPRRRQSGFFPPDSPAVRPPSSLGRNRPVTSAGFYPPLPTSRPTSPTKRPMIRPNQIQAPISSRKPPTTTRPRVDVSGKATPLARDGIHRDKKPPGTQPLVTQPTFTSVSSKLKSSAALRETIANSKAARKATPRYEADEVVKPVNRYHDLPAPPDESNIHVNLLQKRINMARNDGRLNMSGMGLKAFPDQVLKMYESENMTDGPAWYESVDLVRLDASNNEIENLGWDDMLAEQSGDQPRDNIFGALQTLNLQGNRLQSLPASLRGLENMAVLNLSRNNLGQSMDEIFDIVLSMSSLRELRLAENHFSGHLPPFSQCSNLEILDLHDNAFTSLPEQLAECRKLRRLDVSSNRITKIPLLHLPELTNLSISSNQIDIESLMPNLTAPKLTDLDISVCRVSRLPALRANLPSLTVLTAFDNSISTLEDLEILRGMEVLDLRNNDLRALPAELSLLGLKKLMVSGNPMRAPRREILEGTTERLMEWLKGRLPAGTLDEETF
ncbi:MAG: hypothetical protein Q9208_003532 [Pyrenodesmia sp. 3 TL-2023]